jgi:hypothetical protein
VSAAPTSAGLSPPSDPPLDRPGEVARPRIVEILVIVSLLGVYGRHLGQTLERRSLARGFATIARFFCTATTDTIRAHIQRGLMRLIALESVLMQRARRGGDLRIQAPRATSRRATPVKDAAANGQEAGSEAREALTPAQDAAAQEAAIAAGARLARRIARNAPLTLDNLPRMKAIIAEVRRNPVGRTIAAICRDFGIAPALCNGAFWNNLFDAIRLHGGSHSGFTREMKRREKRFDKEEWKHPGLELPEETRDGIHRVLGFFIGETPVWPFAAVAAPMAAVAAVATGPP